MLNLFFGFLAFTLTVIAYYQTERLKFLKVNTFAAFFFSLTLLVNDGITGALVSFINVIVYIVAIYTSKRIREKLTMVVPFLAFFIAMQAFEENIHTNYLHVINIEFIPYIPAIASFFVAFSALQQSIFRNKVLLLIGLLFWGIYSISIGAVLALATDMIGIVVLIISMRKLQQEKLYGTH